MQTNPSPNTGPELPEFRRATPSRRRWLVGIVVCGTLLAGAGAYGAYTLRETGRKPPTARAALYLEKRAPRLLTGEAPPASREDFEDSRRAQAAMVKSRMVLNTALRQLQARDLPVLREQADPLPWLERSLRVDFDLAPEIMRVSLEGGKPDGLAEILNAVVAAYLQEIVEKERNERNIRLEALKKLHTNYETVLSDKRKTLRRLATSVGGDLDSPLQRDLLFQDLLDCKRELRRVRLERAAARAQAAKADQPSPTDAPLAAKEELLRAEEKELLARLNPRAAVDLEPLRADIDQVNKVAERVAAEVEVLKVELQAPERIRVLEEASIGRDE
jgi:hypothetical protein